MFEIQTDLIKIKFPIPSPQKASQDVSNQIVFHDISSCFPLTLGPGFRNKYICPPSHIFELQLEYSGKTGDWLLVCYRLHLTGDEAIKNWELKKQKYEIQQEKDNQKILEKIAVEEKAHLERLGELMDSILGESND